MTPQDPAVPPIPAAPPRAPGRRSRWLGSLLALLVVGLLGVGWYLVQRAAPADPAAGAPW